MAAMRAARYRAPPWEPGSTGRLEIESMLVSTRSHSTGRGSAVVLARARTRVLPTSFHPELRTWSRLLPGRAVSGPRSLRLLRAAGRKKPQSDVEIESCGPCDVVVVQPKASASRGVVVWIHGGGMVLGGAADDLGALRAMANELSALFVSVDYRL